VARWEANGRSDGWTDTAHNMIGPSGGGARSRYFGKEPRLGTTQSAKERVRDSSSLAGDAQQSLVTYIQYTTVRHSDVSWDDELGGAMCM
jgi:hypothetical protein